MKTSDRGDSFSEVFGLEDPRRLELAHAVVIRVAGYLRS